MGVEKKKNKLVIGGCRSGKSGYAMALAEKSAPQNRIYIATCVPLDDEMDDRVRKHQEERDHTWQTVETPVAVAEKIRELGAHAGVILVDCLTLWVTNLVMKELTEREVFDHVADLVAASAACPCPVIFVANEVGMGIVPDNKLARFFRDMAGYVNQQMASFADQVVWMVAGIPVMIKPGPEVS